MKHFKNIILAVVCKGAKRMQGNLWGGHFRSPAGAIMLAEVQHKQERWKSGHNPKIF